MSEKFTFFWSGVFSQWAKTNFKVEVPTELHLATLWFNCAEQYMMYMKAATFGDWQVAKKIITSSNPKQHKSLGRQVTPFDAAKWSAICEQIVYDGNRAKFVQNSHLLKQLLDTRGTTLVEASPYDTLWGIGLSELDPRARQRDTWQGKNLLGETLTRLREDLIKEGVTC